jgi:hypothetical protein
MGWSSTGYTGQIGNVTVIDGAKVETSDLETILWCLPYVIPTVLLSSAHEIDGTHFGTSKFAHSG